MVFYKQKSVYLVLLSYGDGYGYRISSKQSAGSSIVCEIGCTYRHQNAINSSQSEASILVSMGVDGEKCWSRSEKLLEQV